MLQGDSIRALCIFLIFFALLAFHGGKSVVVVANSSINGGDFIRISGTQFVMNGRPFHSNGFNAYWLMYMASDPSERGKVTTTFQQAKAYGTTLVRTWAFSDGGYRPLQYKPGYYNEDMFKGLDFVIAEARKHGVYLILSFVNNYENYGGRKQYIEWARETGQSLSSDDDFYRNPVVKGFYKNHVKAVLTRVNTITGVAYKDDPTIFAWELMNEPRCQSDLSGNTLQEWIKEMAAHVKSIDSSHLLEVGLEGFYGESMPDRKRFNPGYQVGTDFISNNQIRGIDFATIHAYPDQWVSSGEESSFLGSWLESHIQDSARVLRKPILITEFGKSSRDGGYSANVRDNFFGVVFNSVYVSARSGGPCAGALFWHVLAQGMDNFRDGYEVIFSECPSTTDVISQQSHKLSALG